MTGLDFKQHVIIEIATIVTDSNLNILSEGPVIAINQSEQKLSLMDEWNVKTHTNTGLLARVKASTYNEQQAELVTIAFLEQLVPMGVSPICGNSVSQDYRFLLKYMANLAKYFHYRSIDVSTLKELASRWKSDILLGLEKQNTHQALEDLRESIAELVYYRQHFIKL